MASIVELSAPAVEALDTETVLNFLKQPETSPDVSLLETIIIPAARRTLEDLTGLTLAQRDFVQYKEGFPFFPYFQSPYAPLFGDDPALIQQALNYLKSWEQKVA